MQNPGSDAGVFVWERLLNVIASKAKQSSDADADWIAASQELLAMTG
jgi:hypothetical protein